MSGMKSQEKDPQSSLFSTPLERLCDKNQPIYKLANVIDWEVFERAFGPYYCEDNGRPAKPVRLMVGLHYLKAIFGESDESVVEKWVQNPYWQYFCGETEFCHELPIDPTVMNKWRKRVSVAGFETLLNQSIEAALELGVLKQEHLRRVNVDTTVQEKAITFPTDAKLYHRMREKLVKQAKLHGVELRQTYTRKSKWALIMQSRYRHARQCKRANAELRKVKTYFGRVLRDLDRKTKDIKRSDKLTELLELAHRLFKQKREDKNKIYSLHAPEVECIAKGKAHKKYEFGCKVSVVTSSQGNFVLGAKAMHGNPYDGHTLKDALDQSKRMMADQSQSIEEAFVDLGYRGSSHEQIKVHVVKRGLKRLTPALRRWFKRRAAIEPIIGHMKNDNGGVGSRNYLLGKTGDEINAIMIGFGFNMRKCLRELSFCLLRIMYPELFCQIAKKFWMLNMTPALSTY
jgi:transposase, IS5 family